MAWNMREGNYPLQTDVEQYLPASSPPSPQWFLHMQEGDYPYYPFPPLVSTMSAPFPKGIMLQNPNDYPYLEGTLLPTIGSPYPDLWSITDDLPYIPCFTEIERLEPEYPLSLWHISDDLPYKISFPKIIPLEYPTTLSRVNVLYNIKYDNIVHYDIPLKLNEANIPIYSFGGTFYGFAYIDTNNCLTVQSQNNVIQFWLPDPVELNDSEVEVQLGKFDYVDNATIRLCIADEIPEDWDLSTIKCTETGEPYGVINYTTEEIGTKYIGFMITDATIAINKIKIDGVEI